MDAEKENINRTSGHRPVSKPLEKGRSRGGAGGKHEEEQEEEHKWSVHLIEIYYRCISAQRLCSSPSYVSFMGKCQPNGESQ